ncbi:MAG: MbnP family protein [Crocinitomicaceae bacterium]
MSFPFKLSSVLLFTFSFLVDMKAQTKVSFSAMTDDGKLELNQPFKVNGFEDSIQLFTFKFYISELAFWNNEELVFTDNKKYHLVDFEQPASLSFLENIPTNRSFNSIRFNLGIDSVTNSAGALGEELDPTNGMYWTWQSGYINFKMEGSSEMCPARNHFFQFHLGGYLSPFAAWRTVNMIVENETSVEIKFDVSEFFKQVNVAQTYQIMRPSEPAMKLSDLASTLFYLSK